MTTYELTTKTFGKSARKEVLDILGHGYTGKRHGDMINIYNQSKHVGYVLEGNYQRPVATYRAFN